jgi:hypothetical protein
MVYYLGRDVKAWILTECTTRGVQNTSQEAALGGSGTNSSAYFAQPLTTGSVVSGYALADITGVDLGIGVTDEDITYMGQKSVLKAEIKKETTISLTAKKSTVLWDIIFNGPTKSGEEITSGTVNQGARWGVAENSSTLNRIANGLFAPKDHVEGSDVSFGYRVIVQLKGSTEYFAVPGCTITSHSVTLNADGTTEETMEFQSNVTPIITAAVNATLVGRLATSDV